jgi:hypothetical protein
MKTLHALAGLLVSLVLFAGSEASAQSCTSLVKQQFDFLKLGGNRYIIVNAVTLTPASASVSPVASSISGYLNGHVPESYVSLPGGPALRLPARLTSPASSGFQSFNDRTHWSAGPSGYVLQKYSAFSDDKVQLELDDTGKMSVTLNTWGNGKHSIASPTCVGKVLYGYVGTIFYAFTFTQYNLTLPL